jgi:hypothetical protein
MLPRMPQLRHPVGNLHVTTGVERIASRICTTIDTADAKRLGDVLPAAQSRRSQHVEANLGCCSVAAAAWLEQTGGSSLLWEWNYTGPAVSASGTFTTDDKPDADGFYHIIGITGTADGGRITGLQAAGTAIPGNSGFPVDNLVAPTEPQLTMHGFGFLVSNGDYHNPFFNKNYLDYISLPPYVDGGGTEPVIHFMAAPVPAW